MRKWGNLVGWIGSLHVDQDILFKVLYREGKSEKSNVEEEEWRNGPNRLSELGKSLGTPQQMESVFTCPLL